MVGEQGSAHVQPGGNRYVRSTHHCSQLHRARLPLDATVSYRELASGPQGRHEAGALDKMHLHRTTKVFLAFEKQNAALIGADYLWLKINDTCQEASADVHLSQQHR